MLSRLDGRAVSISVYLDNRCIALLLLNNTYTLVFFPSVLPPPHPPLSTPCLQVQFDGEEGVQTVNPTSIMKNWSRVRLTTTCRRCCVRLMSPFFPLFLEGVSFTITNPLTTPSSFPSYCKHRCRSSQRTT